MANLITIDIYKQAKAITSAKDDQRLDLIVSSVSQLVKTYCNNSFTDFVTSPLDEYFSPEWSESLVQVSESPLIAVSEVSDRTSVGEDYILLEVDVDYVVNLKTDTVKRLGQSWPVGVDAVKVTYTAGYASTPADLLLALVDLVSYYYKEEHKMSRVSGSSTMRNPAGTLEGNVGFPDHIKRVLDLYRMT
jgi:hypothetical protein